MKSFFLAILIVLTSSVHAQPKSADTCICPQTTTVQHDVPVPQVPVLISHRTHNRGRIIAPQSKLSIKNSFNTKVRGQFTGDVTRSLPPFIANYRGNIEIDGSFNTEVQVAPKKTDTVIHQHYYHTYDGEPLYYGAAGYYPGFRSLSDLFFALVALAILACLILYALYQKNGDKSKENPTPANAVKQAPTSSIDEIKMAMEHAAATGSRFTKYDGGGYAVIPIEKKDEKKETFLSDKTAD